MCSLLLVAGCARTPKPVLPGESTYAVRQLRVVGAEQLVYNELLTKLAVRPGSLIVPGQPYNPFRLVEDRHRVEAFWQNAGYFDVAVQEPEVVFDHELHLVDVTWTVEEGAPYTIASVGLREAPAAYETELSALVPFRVGDRVDMEKYRRIRHDLSAVLRSAGYGHATTYSRAFVDRAQKRVHWVYYVDSGPMTVVGAIRAAGTAKVPDDLVLARAGLEPGEPLGDQDLRKAELDLLDTGAFAMVHGQTDADVEDLIIPLPPDTGGVLAAEQVDTSGQLVPRRLDPGLDVTLHVVDAPAVQTRVGVRGQADLARLDASANAELRWRNAFGPLHHLVLRGLAGYGWLWRSASDEPLGVYGQALAQYLQPGFLLRLLDLRVTARFDSLLFPGFNVRDVAGGVGFRTAFTTQLFLDFDAEILQAWTDGYGPFAPSDTAALALADQTRYADTELRTSLIWDARNDGIEPTRGYFASTSAVWAPGGPVGAHRYVRLLAELRGFLPITDAISAAARASSGWVLGEDDAGIPPTARFFGGGGFGVRGFGEQQQSSIVPLCATTEDCDNLAVGGRSAAWGSLELRWLPFRQLYGVTLFVDAGGIGDDADPFAQGVAVATGLGLRVRTWYLPVAVDLSYRVLDDDRSESLGHFQAFLRIGEAF